MKKNYFVSGQWNAICDSCGEKHKSGDLRKRWDGFMVCGNCFENRHPQDFLRSKPDRQSVPWSRPRSTDTFVPVSVNILDTLYLYEDFDYQNIKPPVVNSDSVSLSESVSTTSQYYRIIPMTGSTTNGTLNGSFLNDFSLNSSDTSFTNTSETFTLTESVSTYFTYTEALADSITLSESIDTFKFVSNPLNVSALNSLSIG